MRETEKALPSRGGCRCRCWSRISASRRTQRSDRAGDSRAAARRSLEELLRIAEPLGVRIAVEVIPNELSRAGSIVHFVEHDLEGAGICLDFGHAHLDGDVIDAVETVSEHPDRDARARQPGPQRRSPAALRRHDRLGRHAAGGQKIGYDGPFTFEIVPNGSTKETLAKARATREQMEKLLTI